MKDITEQDMEKEQVGIEVTDTYYALGTERVRSALETGRQKEGGADGTEN